jgi:hypothetical protein
MGLITWLKLDSNTNDSSGNGRNFTNNSVVFADAKISQGYYNDSGNYARRAFRFDSAYNLQTNFTYAAWINSTGTTTGTHIFYQMAISNNRDCCGVIGYNIAVVNSSGNIVVGYGNTMLFTSINARNKWVHVAVSVGTSDIKIYFNGVLTYTRVYETFVYSGHPLTIGKMGFYYQGPDGFFAWRGFVDELRIYNHALSALEVKRLAHAKVTHLKLNNNLTDAASYINGTGSISYTTDTKRHSHARASGTVTIANGNQPVTGDQTIFEEYFVTPSDQEINSIPTSQEMFEDYRPGLYDELVEFRRQVYYDSGKEIKAYQVLKNDQISNIVTSKPRTLNQLQEECFLSFGQIKSYGETILVITKKYLIS